MSRIDEALRRKNGSDDRLSVVGDQEPFAEVWSISKSETAPAPVPEGGAAAKAVVRRLGVVPAPMARTGLVSFSAQWREKLADGPEADPSVVEQFRRLAATLHHARQANGLKSLMVSSASPGDGKTLTAVNLALVLAKSYNYNVLLVDADLRRPSITSVLDLTDGNGLTEALRSPTEQKVGLVSITPRLTLLPAGLPIANSIEVLTSPRMQQILEEASARFDWVILDAPPVGPVADARLLAQMVGATLFVIHAGRTQCPDVQKAIEAIGRDQILGVVLNGVESAEKVGYGDYYAPYGPGAVAGS